LKIAIPTDDGVRVAPRLWRVSSFLVADVSPGDIGTIERRANAPSRRLPSRPVRGERHEDRYRAVADILSDCRVVIAGSIGDVMRRTLARRGIEVVITSEDLVDRVVALFSLALLRDESRIDPEDEELAEATAPSPGGWDDGFDG
jgi:predicted Fe-Mo cluster-binding NifX family protein